MLIRLSIKKITLLLLAWQAAATLFSQTIKPEALNIRQGLSQGYIASLLQDREGFIWAGTKNGLNRYDGRRFKVFTADPADPNALSHDFVSALWEHQDFLLVGTNGGGLNIFHKKTQRFHRMPMKLPDSSALATPAILQVATDAQGHIWLINWITYLEGDMYRIVVPPGFWGRLANAPQADWSGVSVQKHHDHYVRRFQVSRNGRRIYFTKDSILTEIDVETQKEKRLVLPTNTMRVPLFEGEKGVLWLSSNEGFWKFDGLTWTNYPTDYPVRDFLTTGPDNQILVYTRDRELLCLPWKGGIPELLRSNALLKVNSEGTSQGIFDNSGNIWYGTVGFGLYRANPRLGRFRHYFPGRSVYSQPIGTADGAFVYFDDLNGLVTSSPNSRHPLIQGRGKLPGIGAHGRYQMAKDGTHWLLFIDNAKQSCLLRISPDGSSHKVFPTPDNEFRPGNLALDKQGVVWIGLNGRLHRFDPATEQFNTFPYSTVLPFSHDVRALAQTPNGHWWIGTSNGLVEATPEGNALQFNLWKNEADNPNSLRNDDIACLLPDPNDQNLLWIGTKGGGLNRLDTRTGRFFHLTARTGLPNEVIYGILPDSAGYLWMSSNKGLIRYHPQTGTLKNFTEDDGLQSDEFNTWAYGISPKGELLFGGVNGLNVFHPKDFEDNPVLPRVYLTGLKVNNKPVSHGDSTGLLHTAIEFAGELRLPFHQNSITLEFAALEFTTPSKNRFRYYLEGAEAEWAHESDEPSAQYLNLAPGNYIFLVMASNNDGVWNPEPTQLRITVLPPWYRSWWAYLFYALVAGALVYLYLRIRLRQLNLQQKLALEHREAERIRELDQFKTRLYTNITHEFRTPLTVILGVTEQLEKQTPPDKFPDLPAANTFAAGLRQRLALVRRNGRNLLDLVNQLLDLAKAETNQLKVNLVQGDMVRYVRYIAESFHSLANHSNVMLRVESRTPELFMDYDPEKLRQILSNLLSNALKYTPSGGKVVVQLAVDGENLVVSVADTGAGIAPKDLPHVFDRFYQADNAVTKAGGTGIGLALTRELVKLLGGSISVESTEGKGTVFTIKMPITKDASGASAQPPIAQDDIFQKPMPPVIEVEQADIIGAGVTEFAPGNSSFIIHHSSFPSLLLIEDNPDVVEYLRLCLEGHYRLDFAYNGRVGIEQALEHPPDLILSDVMMPEKDGFEVCDTLKNDLRTSHIPIVLLTAKADVESRIAGLRRGADAYLAKPFHPEELLVTLEKLLENRRRLQARYGSLSVEVPHPAVSEKLKTADTEPEDAFLETLRQAVEKRLHESGLSADDVTREVGMGRSNLYAKLSALTGLSFNVYVRTLRLNKAKYLLETTDRNVSEAAFEVGFNDPKYFSRVFAEHFGVAPSGVRRG